eukprot:3915132-Rhodomonas_salina.2
MTRMRSCVAGARQRTAPSPTLASPSRQSGTVAGSTHATGPASPRLLPLIGTSWTHRTRVIVRARP